MDLVVVRQQLSMGMPLTSINLRVVDYSRVSTQLLLQKKSLKNQVEHFDKMIKSNNAWTYVKSYVDDGITGTSDVKRQDFMRMIEDARKGKFDLIITKEISRFSRNTLDSIKYTRELLSYGVAVLFVNDNINTALPDSELRLTIMASMAQDEIRRLSERVHFGMDRALENHEILGNNSLYGYEKNKDTGCLSVISKEATVVLRLFQMYALEEKSLNQIAKVFNEEGIKTCRNKSWCISTLGRMIQNHKYKGWYCGGKTRIEDYITKKQIPVPKEDWLLFPDVKRIPPLVTEELWDKANERYEKQKELYSLKTDSEGTNPSDKILRRQVSFRQIYPFSSKILCAEHNEIFFRRKLKSETDINWRCSVYYNEGKTACASPDIRDTELNIIFTDIFQSLSINKDKIFNILSNLYQENVNANGFNEKIVNFQSQIVKLQMKKDKILELSMEGKITNDEFFIKNNEFNSEISKIQKSITEIEVEKSSFDELNNEKSALDILLKDKIDSFEVKNKIIDLLLDRIIVSKINNNVEEVELNIFLNLSKKYATPILDKTTNPIRKQFQGIRPFYRKDFELKRGYNVTGTRRYKMLFHVNCYICM